MLLLSIVVLVSSGIYYSESQSDDNCLDGFIDYNLLQQKASQIKIPNGYGDLSNNTLSSDYYLLPNHEFICPSTISGFLLGVEVRNDSSRDQFPSVSLYSRDPGQGNERYSPVSDSNRTISVGANVFRSSGVYEYHLSSNLQFSENYILGVYQPPLDQSAVQLYYITESGSRLCRCTVRNSVRIRQDCVCQEDRSILLLPITDDVSCISSTFISESQIKSEAQKITAVDDEYNSNEILFKDIKFNCDGYITHVIIGTKNLSSTLNPPEIRLWRANGTGYEQTGQSMQLAYDDATQGVSTPYLRWYNLSSPISVQKGDFLGIYNYLPKDQADCLIYYQKYNGPKNYYPNSSETGNNHYPLLSVVFAVSVPTSSVSSTKSFSKSLATKTSSPTSTESSTMMENSASTKSSTIMESSASTKSSTIMESSASTKSSTTMESSASTKSSTIMESSASTKSSTIMESSASTKSSTIMESSASTKSSTIMESSASTKSSTMMENSASTSTENFASMESRVNMKSSAVTSVQTSTKSISNTEELNMESLTNTKSSSTTRSQVVTRNSQTNTIATRASERPTSLKRPETTSSKRSDYTTFQTTTPPPRIESAAGGVGAGVVAGPMIAILLVVVTVAGLIIALVFFLQKKKKRRSENVTLPSVDDSYKGLTNMVYSGLPTNNGGGISNQVYDGSPNLCEGGLTNMVYSGVPLSNAGKPGYESDLTLSNPVYEANDTEKLKPAMYEPVPSTVNDCGGHYEVPNSVKPNQASPLPCAEYEMCDTDLTEEKIGVETHERNDFVEEPIYWEPESNTEGIYQQLTGKGFHEISREMISVSEQIGSGQFGTVHKGTWNATRGPKLVAIKTLKSSATEKEEVMFLQEAAINGQFHHRNVVKLCGVVTVGHPIMIVLEYATNGDLSKYLINMRPVPGELPDDSFPTTLNDFSYNVASGMKYLARKKFIHRDLAARNVLVGDGKICKIADFGMSIELQDENYYASHGSMIPLKWTAPEAIHRKKYSTQSDVWSFGSVLYEIWSVGHKPFEQHTNQEYIRLVESGHRLCPPPGCPEVIYNMMIQCWHPDASSRPTFDDLQSMLEDSESITSEINLKAFTGSVDPYPDVQKIF